MDKTVSARSARCPHCGVTVKLGAQRALTIVSGIGCIAMAMINPMTWKALAGQDSPIYLVFSAGLIVVGAFALISMNKVRCPKCRKRFVRK